MITEERLRLAQELFAKIQARYPEISLGRIRQSPEHPDDTWLYVIAPMDEDREMEMFGYAAELESDLLIEYDYHFCTMPQNPTLVAA
ncbi:MAG: hypothetical protein EAZ92_17695 [Candidatus Kapaibacterium sp.]|nr:MAG: hypothetical protein EAZ92_17695 [Candidatus Kapabacteria bacterium]